MFAQINRSEHEARIAFFNPDRHPVRTGDGLRYRTNLLRYRFDYGFCGEVKHKAKGFCKYPDIALSDAARDKLALVMPSADFGSCLEKHQWWKHGSCQQMHADQYFIEASRLTGLVNESRMAKLLADSSGKMQSTATLRQAFTDEFGKQSAKRISFHCSRGLLTEIRLSLPATLDASLELKHLLARQAPELRDSCPASFLVDVPG